MRFRRLHLILILLAGLFAFQGSLAYAMPREKTRTEVVVSSSAQEVQGEVKPASVRRTFVILDEVLTSSSHHILLRSLLVDCQHHHSTL